MKNVKLGLVALVISAGSLFAFTGIQTASIKGKITPPESSVKAWAISGTDTVSAPINAGEFNFSNLKEGKYQIIIEATAPYKNASKENVEVKNGEVTDIGEIVVTQ